MLYRFKILNYGCLVCCYIAILMTSYVYADEELMQVAMHDRCNPDDLTCGLPMECCCKPTHNYDFRISLKNETEGRSIPVHVLCDNVTDVPPRFPERAESLKILKSQISQLSGDSFKASNLPNVTNIYIWKNLKLRVIKNFAFHGFENLRTIVLEDLPALEVIEEKAFSNLPSLRELRLKQTGLKTVPMFTGLSSTSMVPLKIILEDTKIRQIASGAFQSLPGRIKIVQLSWNMDLTSINGFAFNGSSIAQLIFSDNKQLSTIHPRAFYGMPKLEKLALRGSAISKLPTQDLKTLIEIDVRRVPLLHRFPAAQELPSLRVAALTYTYHCCSLNAYGFGNLFGENTNQKHSNKEIIPCSQSSSRMNLTNWNTVVEHTDSTFTNDSNPQDKNQYIDYYEQDFYDMDWKNLSLPNYVHTVPENGDLVSTYTDREDPEAYDRMPFLHKLYNQFDDGSFENEYELSTAPVSDGEKWGEPSLTPDMPTDAALIVDAVELCYKVNGVEYKDIYHTPVRCTPEPDAFNPCENVLGTSVLPAISWIVSALAIIGNFFVILVLSVVTCDRVCARQHHLSVQKFLVLNLAVADMCMGLYLLMVSSMDAKSSGEYYKYGVEWQTGIGCRIAGFLSIFSSQLSVYTLSVISLERWYAIRFAIQLDKRMTLRCARICILFGWLLSGLLAMLPLVGVNNYEKTSICLPFDVSNTSGMVYVGFLLFISIGAFVVDVICYLWMYTAVRTVSFTDGRKRRNSASSSKSGAYHGTTATADAVVAKKMAVLVFTNFACFFPISFFALTAAAGRPLISISQSKILLVIFYPLNSCCNPFLYAILTKSFRRDLLAWFTSRGYCVSLAAKLNGAHWRRNSVDPGSAERKDTYVRKRIQQCVKYVSKKKSVHMEGVGEASANDFDRSNRKRNLKPLHLHNGMKTKNLDNNSNSISSYNSVGNSRTHQNGVSRFFKLALGSKKHTEPTTPTEKLVPDERHRNSTRPIFPEIRWFRSQRSRARPTAGDTTQPRPRPEDFSPLMETLDSRNECEFSMQTYDPKVSNPRFGRRASKSRHSTTTIETRLTVGGNARGSVDNENVLQDHGASTP